MPWNALRPLGGLGGSPFGGGSIGGPLGVPLTNPYTSTPTANPLGQTGAPAAATTADQPWYKDPKFWINAVLMGGSAFLNNRAQGRANDTANRQVSLNDENEKARLGLDRERFGEEKVDLQRKREADLQAAPYRTAVLQALLGRLGVPSPGGAGAMPSASGLTPGQPMPSTAGTQINPQLEQILALLGGGR